MTNELQFLHNVSLFANLAATELEPLAQRLVVRRYREGERIFEQGTPGSSLYIVKTGLVAVDVTDRQGHTQVVAQFGPGQTFGEFGLLDGMPRSAGAVACERSELMVLTRPEFFIYLEQHPSVAINLLVLISRRLRFATQQTEHETTPLPTLQRLAHLLYDLGERYGEADDGAVILSIRLSQGEIAGILGCPRSEAEEAVEILRQRGLIDMRALQVTIRDLEGLHAAAS